MGLLPALSAKVVVVWTLHDTWAFTGYCYQPLDCMRWKTGCGRCPQVRRPSTIPIRLSERPVLDLTNIAWRIKGSILRRSRCVLVAPSRWLRGMIAASPLTAGMRSEHVPYGVDCTVFSPSRRMAARSRLGLDTKGPVVLQIADKGERDGERALRLVAEDDHALGMLLWAGSDRPTVSPPRGWQVRVAGVVHSEEQMADCYAAADAFLLPTFADNFPNTALESIACGTPVAAYDVGGVGEIVRDGITGGLARVGDREDLARVLRTVLAGSEGGTKLRGSARRVAEVEFSLERQARAYLRLYDELLSQPAGEAV
jgi:glycosyltransferase involved in cell wall biosynthesis